MPGRDRTGPIGTGPIGRGLGPCWDEDAPVPQAGFFGAGWGRRRGWRFWQRGGYQMPYMTAEDEKSALKQQETWLTSRLDWVKKRLQENEEKSE
jgi:hypothetical protein